MHLACYKDAANYVITQYNRIKNQDITHLKACLANGDPFVFGFMVYDNWYNNNPPNTHIPLPGPNDKLVAGHAVLCVGYDDRTQLFRIRNSWGDQVGDKGYF
ncbi:C1 family peptidase [Candidatus Liberibacter sp.]|uniref:C1 family peptidase n=1 Tax=Candidatus Liberibacter sp. TaxID=34022 RepID=UPI001C71072B|nr:C1 family peptidase [Candidatus Liberibacter sp.]